MPAYYRGYIGELVLEGGARETVTVPRRRIAWAFVVLRPEGFVVRSAHLTEAAAKVELDRYVREWKGQPRHPGQVCQVLNVRAQTRAG